MTPHDEARARMRVSDDDRFRTAETLREAAGVGRLDIDELEERLEAAHAAKTWGDLDPLTEDLPGHRAGGAAPATRASSGELVRRPDNWVARHSDAEPVRSWRLAVLSGVQRRGDWLVPASLTVVAHMGGADLDLRRARFSAPEVVITAVALMGGITVVVPPDVDVVVDGVGVMGGFGFEGPSNRTGAQLVPGSPRVRVRGFAFWGGVSVVRKPVR